MELEASWEFGIKQVGGGYEVALRQNGNLTPFFTETIDLDTVRHSIDFYRDIPNVEVFISITRAPRQEELADLVKHAFRLNKHHQAREAALEPVLVQ
ncbi:hypothetical protein HYV81_01070 [Candidatus Woesearchaeota archaeon]|nr:hypothetical protein [Candidatus Woesearchaeota archaeon]